MRSVFLPLIGSRFNLGGGHGRIEVEGRHPQRLGVGRLDAEAAVTGLFEYVGFVGNRTNFREVGLGGEIRPVRGLAQRLREARRMGMKRAFVPAGSKIDGDPGIEIVGINDINEVIEICVG